LIYGEVGICVVFSPISLTMDSARFAFHG